LRGARALHTRRPTPSHLALALATPDGAALALEPAAGEAPPVENGGRPEERRRRQPMKITINVDCTPLEARQFMGLPDVEPMQKAAMAEIEKRMMAELERFSPEALFKAWLPIAGMNADWLQEFFKRAAS
jgi:Family of unknown function (DUF6489)